MKKKSLELSVTIIREIVPSGHILNSLPIPLYSFTQALTPEVLFKCSNVDLRTTTAAKACVSVSPYKAAIKLKSLKMGMMDGHFIFQMD